MPHDEILDLLPLYLLGELDRETEERIGAHLESCATCSAELAALADCARAVEEMPPPASRTRGPLLRAAALIAAFLLGMAVETLRRPAAEPPRRGSDPISAATAADRRDLDAAPNGLARLLLASRRLP
ncbi:MAG: zf-HC2 domain-containing protein [Planctomycetes bacterium]|nr:zf-HC2 domain-containing protein [Planctomycetota bacterium]